MAKYSMNALGIHMFVGTKCFKTSLTNNQNPYLVMQSKEYFKNILILHPLRIQKLSFLDISMHTKEHKFGFVLGQIKDMNLLNDPLLCGGGTIDENEFFDDLVNALKTISII